jgi:hypothetical protein
MEHSARIDGGVHMNRTEVVEAVIGILQEFQGDVSAAVPEITEQTRPIGDLEEFDSLTGVLVTVHCLDRINLGSGEKIQSLFVEEDGRGRLRALTVGQVADRIMKLGPKA